MIQFEQRMDKEQVVQQPHPQRKKTKRSGKIIGNKSFDAFEHAYRSLENQVKKG